MNFKKTCKSIASFVLGAGMMFSGLASNNLSKALFTEECRDALIRLNNEEYWKNFIESLHKLPNARPDLKLSLPEDYDECIQWQLEQSTKDFAKCFEGNYKYSISQFDYTSCRYTLISHLILALYYYTHGEHEFSSIDLLRKDLSPLRNLLETVAQCASFDKITPGQIDWPEPYDFDVEDLTETQKTKIASHINESLPRVLTSEDMVNLIRLTHTRLTGRSINVQPLNCCMGCIRHLIWISCDVYTIKPSTWALTIACKLIELTEQIPEALEASVRIADYVVNELNSNRENSLFNLNPKNEEKRLYDYIAKTLNEKQQSQN